MQLQRTGSVPSTVVVTTASAPPAASDAAAPAPQEDSAFVADPESGQGLPPQRSQHLTLALLTDRTASQRLDHLYRFVLNERSISYEDAYAALQVLPRGKDWGLSKPKLKAKVVKKLKRDKKPLDKVQLKNLMRENGLGDWKRSNHEKMDLEIVALLLSQLAPLTAAQGRDLEHLGKDIVQRSQGYSQSIDNFKSDCRALVGLLVQKAVR